jgi:hypothetical protein
VPRAPRLTGCEHHLFFDMSWRPTAAREDPCFVCLLLSFPFIFLRILYFSAFCYVSVRDLCALTHQLCVATTALSKLPITAAGATALSGLTSILCTSRDLSRLLFSSRSLCRTACNLLVSSGSRGGGAESHTYSPHDARSIRIRALRFRQWTSSIPLALFIHSACQPLEARRNGSET